MQGPSALTSVGPFQRRSPCAECCSSSSPLSTVQPRCDKYARRKAKQTKLQLDSEPLIDDYYT